MTSAPPPGGVPVTWQPLPKVPGATASAWLGVIGLVSVVLCCGLFLLLSPFAWATGSKAVRSFDANPGVFSARSTANVGRITGIIGTVLLFFAVIAWVYVITLTGMGLDLTQLENAG